MNPPTCQTCHSPLPDNAPDGVCPACLLKRTFEEAGPLPPPEEELQQLSAAFPQLVIEEMIGQGGMGRVYRAQQPHLNRTVALKVLSAERANDPEWLERFSREARALARLSHPHIVQVYDFGEKPVPHLLMEHIEGVNLRQAMQNGGLTTREALAIVPKLCDALHYAHEHGVLHRDIKPENILIDTEGRVKIVDFGLAKLRDENVLPFTLTQSGAKLGTLAYMAPEQVEKPADVDHRADIYSLGVVLYEMLTGELPLGRFPTPSEASGVDARLDGVVMRTLEKRRERRFDDANQFRTGLDMAMAKEAKSEPSSGTMPPRWRTAAVAALLIVAGLNTIRYFGVSSSSPQPPAETQREKRWRIYAEEKPIRDRTQTWVSLTTKADTKEGQTKVLQEIREALRSSDPDTLRAALNAVSGLHQIDFDRTPFRDEARRLLESTIPEIRIAALNVLGGCKPDDTDRARLVKLSATCTEVEISSLLYVFKTLDQNDFTGQDAKIVLSLLERGMAAAQRDGGSMDGLDSRSVLGVIWGSKISPEIEARLIEWSHLQEDGNGEIQASNSNLGYNTFYHALSVHQNKSRTAVKRLIELSYHPDVTNIAGRCLWGLNGTVPDPADRTYLAGEVIKLLDLRSDNYLWKGGLTLLRNCATPDHVPALEQLTKRETLPADSYESLTQTILRLKRPQ